MNEGKLKLILVAESEHLGPRLAELQQSSDRVFHFESVSAAVSALKAEPPSAFNIDAILVAEGMAEDVMGLAEYAPQAAQVMLTHEHSGSASFGVNIPFSSLGDSEPLGWLRAGLAAGRSQRAKVFVHRGSRSVLFANEAALRLMRAPSFGGGLLEEILALPEEAHLEPAWRGTVETTDGAILGVTTTRVGGHWLFVALSDITDVEVGRALHRQEENLILLGRANAVLAHEIGNPLAAIKANLQLVSGEFERLERDSILQYLDRSLSEVSRLSGIVANYLSLVRTPLPEVISMADLVETAFVQVGDLFRSVNIHCVVDPMPANVNVEFGSSHFHQIAWNVAKNAIDSMLRVRAVNSTFRVHAGPIKDGSIDVYFDDNGEGLPTGSADHLFDAFVTTKGSGTGLGLMVCRLLARQFGGEIEMMNLERGARALLRLRVANS